MPYITPNTPNILTHISTFRQDEMQHASRILLLLTNLRKLHNHIGNALSCRRLVPVYVVTKVRLVVILHLVLNPV
jgi:hypothetical protein